MTQNKEEIAERITFDKFANLGLENQVKKMIIQALTEHSASLFTEQQAKDIYAMGYVDGTGYMSNAIAQAFGAEVTSEELNADKAIEKYRNELTDKGK